MPQVGSKVGLENLDEQQINPATEDKQDDIVTAINAVSGLQRATNLEGGGQIAVGTTAVEVSFSGTPESIIIQSDTSNTALLYIGKSDVVSDGSNAICFLVAGQTLTMQYDDTSNAVYVVAAAVSQNFWKGALL